MEVQTQTAIFFGMPLEFWNFLISSLTLIAGVILGSCGLRLADKRTKALLTQAQNDSERLDENHFSSAIASLASESPTIRRSAISRIHFLLRANNARTPFLVEAMAAHLRNENAFFLQARQKLGEHIQKMQVGFDIQGQESGDGCRISYNKALVVSQVSTLFEIRRILEQLAKTEVKDEQIIDTLMYGLNKVETFLDDKNADSAHFIDARGATFPDFAYRGVSFPETLTLYHQIDFSDAIFAERTGDFLGVEKFRKLRFSRCLFNKSMFFAFQLPALENCTFNSCIFRRLNKMYLTGLWRGKGWKDFQFLSGPRVICAIGYLLTIISFQ